MKKWFRMPRSVKEVVTILIGIAVIGAGAWYFFFKEDGQAVGAQSYITTPMLKTTIRDTISGSGNLISNETAEFRNAQEGQIAEIFFKNGDYVEKGQPLFRMTNDALDAALQQAIIDQANAKNTYDRLLMQNSNASGQLRDAQLKVEQRQNAFEAAVKSRENLQVIASESGKITEVNATVGDTLTANTALFAFYSQAKESEEDYQIKLQQARANYETKQKDYDKLNISVDYSGVVSDLSVKPGDTVLANDLLLNVHEIDRLQKATSSDTILKIQQAELNLSNKQKDVQNLEVTAPITGVLSGLNLIPGDAVTTGTTLASVADNRQVIVKVNVPQSFINGVARGNKAEVMITNSARTYSGVVTDVAPTGAQDPSSYAITYPVEITIDNDGTLLAGMSALVEISSSDATFRSVSSLRGTVANETTKVVNPKVSGDIVELRAKNGDWVLEGQVIAVLKNDSVDLAYRQAEEDLKKLLQDEFRAPALATVKEVLVQNGATVQPGQTLVTLLSDSVEASYLQAKNDYEKLLRHETGNADLRNKTAGTLEAIFVKAGDTVQSGQLLAELSSSDALYQEQRALTDLEQAKAELEALMINTSAGELELARLKLDQGTLTLENKQKEVDDLLIKALISGNVTQKIKPVVGDELEKATLLGAIYDYSAYKLIVNVDELEIPRIEIDTQAMVTVDAFPGVQYPARVVEISNEGTVAQGGSTYPVTIQFNTNDPLRAAMTATASIVLEESVDTFAVLKSAVQTFQTGQASSHRVQILVDDEPVWKDVTVGMSTKSMIEITGGLKEGDLVITAVMDNATGNVGASGGMMGGPGVVTSTGPRGGGANVVMLPAGGR